MNDGYDGNREERAERSKFFVCVDLLNAGGGLTVVEAKNEDEAICQFAETNAFAPITDDEGNTVHEVGVIELDRVKVDFDAIAERAKERKAAA